MYSTCDFVAYKSGLTDIEAGVAVYVLGCQDGWVPCMPVGCCGKIAEAEAAVSVNEKKWLVMHMHVQLKLDELHACWLQCLACSCKALTAVGTCCYGSLSCLLNTEGYVSPPREYVINNTVTCCSGLATYAGT
jgi:hypothetical protein